MMGNETKRLIAIVLAVLLLVILAVGLVYYTTMRTADVKITEPETKKILTENPVPADLGQVWEMLYRLQEIDPAPKIVSQEIIDESKLPAEIVLLINPARYTQTIYQVKFEGNQTGYQIQYQIASLLSQNHNYYGRFEQSGWKLGKNAFTAIAGLFNLSKDNYDVLIEQSVIDAKNLNVVITVINK